MLMADASGSEAVRSAPRTTVSLSLGVLLGIGLGLGAFCGAILYWFDPSQFRFYPSCLFHQATGLLCPGCGSLRAIHQLLHGNLSAAFRFNALLVLSLPALAWFAARCALSRLRGQPATASISPKWIYLGLAIALAFSIWRNLHGRA